MHVYLLSKIFLKFKKTWQKKLGRIDHTGGQMPDRMLCESSSSSVLSGLRSKRCHYNLDLNSIH